MQQVDQLYTSAPDDIAAWLNKIDLRQTVDGNDAPATNADLIDPAAGRIIASYPQAATSDVDSAVAAAKKAFSSWSMTKWDDRRALLERFADAIEHDLSRLCYLLVAETGRPLRKAYGEVAMSAAYVRMIAGTSIPEPEYDREGLSIRMMHRPLGVVAAIAPWNAPVVLAVAKIANALIAGDTMVLRPAPQTPLTALHLGMIGRDIFPAGVFNVITGDADVAAALVAHPDVAKISFTGSTATGRQIAAAAAPSLKRVTLELGGNDAAIALADADVAAVADTAYRISLENAGQFCAAIKRLYVHKSIYVDVRDAIMAHAGRARAGDPFDPGSTIAPLQSEVQRSRIVGIIAEAGKGGANILTPDIALPDSGFFVAPTLAENCRPESALVSEEQFGPVLPIMAFDDEDQALAEANAVEHGLGGSIWTADVERGMALAERLICGTAWVNQHGAFTAALPMPLIGQSGVGVDYSHQGIASHMRPMLINARL